MTSALTAALTTAAEAGHGVALPFPPIVFALIALGAFAALLGILWMFRHAVPLLPEDAEYAADRRGTGKVAAGNSRPGGHS